MFTSKISCLTSFLVANTFLSLAKMRRKKEKKGRLKFPSSFSKKAAQRRSKFQETNPGFLLFHVSPKIKKWGSGLFPGSKVQHFPSFFSFSCIFYILNPPGCFSKRTFPIYNCLHLNFCSPKSSYPPSNCRYCLRGGTASIRETHTCNPLRRPFGHRSGLRREALKQWVAQRRPIRIHPGFHIPPISLCACNFFLFGGGFRPESFRGNCELCSRAFGDGCSKMPAFEAQKRRGKRATKYGTGFAH